MDIIDTFNKNYNDAAAKLGMTGGETGKSRPKISDLTEGEDFLGYLNETKDLKKIYELIKNNLKDPEKVNEFLKAILKGRKKETKEAMVSGGAVGMFDANAFTKGEFKEATATDSSGSYETNKIWAKSMNKKHWRNAKANIMPGAKRVQVKKKCKRFPYCNQGDIKALNIFEGEIYENILEKISRETGLDRNYIKNIIEIETKHSNQ
jgi:hypothetical protein